MQHIRSAYAEWLRDRARAEVAGGLDEIRAILDDLPQYFVESSEHWPPNERLAVMLARIKMRAWTPQARQALRLLRNKRDVMPDTVAPEQILAARKDLTEEEERAEALFKWPPEDMNSRVLASLGAARRRGEFKIDARTIKRTVKHHMDLALGASRKVPTEPGWLLYVAPSGGLFVNTYVYFGGKAGGQFGYFQALRGGREMDAAIPGHGEFLSNIAKLDLLGFGTQWSCMREADLEVSAAAAARFAIDLVRAVPSFAGAH